MNPQLLWSRSEVWGLRAMSFWDGGKALLHRISLHVSSLDAPLSAGDRRSVLGIDLDRENIRSAQLLCRWLYGLLMTVLVENRQDLNARNEAVPACILGVYMSHLHPAPVLQQHSKTLKYLLRIGGALGQRI